MNIKLKIFIEINYNYVIKIWNIHAYIYTMTKYITSWSIGWMVKELVCGHGNEGSIPFNDILNLGLDDYNMIT